MIDNEVLRKKLQTKLKKLKLSEGEKNSMVKELNYLSDLLVEVYIQKTQNGNR